MKRSGVDLSIKNNKYVDLQISLQCFFFSFFSRRFCDEKKVFFSELKQLHNICRFSCCQRMGQFFFSFSYLFFFLYRKEQKKSETRWGPSFFLFNSLPVGAWRASLTTHLDAVTRGRPIRSTTTKILVPCYVRVTIFRRGVEYQTAIKNNEKEKGII